MLLALGPGSRADKADGGGGCEQAQNEGARGQPAVPPHVDHRVAGPSTTGSLVEDETLIEALTVTKETAHEVTEKLSISAETEIRINSAREEFRPGTT